MAEQPSEPARPGDSDAEQNRRYSALRNPVAFVTKQLGADPWQKQREILNAVAQHDRVAVRSCNGSGKTCIAAHVVVWWLMAHDQATVVTTAPTDRQVRQLLWREINAIHSAHAGLIGGSVSATKLEIDQQRIAHGFSTDREQRFQGFHRRNILFVVDEASGVREQIFEAIEGSMTARNAKILIIGNPNSLEGYFYDAFHKNRTVWKTIHISAFDTPNLRSEEATGNALGLLTREWVENARDMWGEQSPAYQTRVLGQFPSSAEDTLIPLQLIEAAVARDPAANEPGNQQTVMGLDVARFGNDRTVACVRTGRAVTNLEVFPRGEDTMRVAGRALRLAEETRVDAIVVDEVGIGAGVLDRLRETGRREAIGINGGKRPRNTERFVNVRAELFDALRTRFNQGDISIPNDPELMSELASLKYAFNSRGQMILEDKQRIRRQGRKSPDRADALMLAFTPDASPTPLFWA